MVIRGLKTALTEKLVKVLGLQTAIEPTALDYIKSIQPTLDLNPVPVVDVVETKTASGTIFTTPTNKDFFLTGFIINVSTDENDNDGFGQITVVMKNGSSRIIGKAFVRAEATPSSSVANLVSNLTVPILLKRGTNISAALSSVNALSTTIYGYTVEDK